MSNMYESEWEAEEEAQGGIATELEEEFHEGEEEAGHEGEGWLGAIGNIAGSLLGEGEEEGEEEGVLEGEEEGEEEGFFEGEEEAGLEGEGWLGTIGNIASSLLGEGEEEREEEGFLEGEEEGEEEGFFESEDETEEFFGKIGRFLKRAAPILKRVAKVAAPIVGTAIGGPFGGMLGKVASSALGEGEGETEDETEVEGEEEMAHEIASHEASHNEALAEVMAEAASHEAHEGEAEAMAGAAAVTVISPSDRRALRRILPHLVRGTAILTRILRRNKRTKVLVRTVPTIFRRTVRDLKRRAAAGQPVTRKTAARAAAKQVRRVLSSPKACTAAIRRNIKVSRIYKRPRRRPTYGTRTRVSTAARRRRGRY
jgi:hypothetical protein